MKIAIIGDTHFGINKFSKNSFENQISFFEKQFFPYLRENNITTIIQLGDLLHYRKSIDIDFFDMLANRFFSQLKDYKFYTLLGNHDIYYKNHKETNLIKYFAKLHDFVCVESILRKDNLLFVSWLLENEEIDYDENHNDIEYIFGHFELNGFPISKTEKCESHFDESLFKNFKNLKKVISGHFHLKSEKGKILYAGTPYQMNFGDVGDKRGFYVLDTENYILEFIENRISKRYIDINYFDGSIELIDVQNIQTNIKDIDLSILKNNEIRLNVYGDISKKLSKFIEKLRKNDINISKFVDKIEYKIENEEKDIDDVKEFIIENVKKYNENLLPKVENLLERTKDLI